jgi:hypothetical protein
LSRWLPWAAILLFGLVALTRVAIVEWTPLWVDEAFSLAMATGHSLEHPSAVADRARGDYVEAPRALPASEYRRYLEHDDPPAGPERVLRAVMLSDTSPPLYYLLLHGWTRVLGTGDAALRLFSTFWALACFPLLWSLAKRVGGPAAAVPTCVLFYATPIGLDYSLEGGCTRSCGSSPSATRGPPWHCTVGDSASTCSPSG